MNKNFYEETIDIKTLNQYTAVNTSRKKKKKKNISRTIVYKTK